MKLFHQRNPTLQLNDHGISRAFRALFFSTDTLFSSASLAPADTLPGRILKAGDPTASIIPVLEKWVEEGKYVKRVDLKIVIKQLRRRRLFGHALQISQWMSAQKWWGRRQSPGDLAVQMDLISKIHGLEKAEEYFNSIHNESRSFEVYGALLNCYAHKNCLEKAEVTMQKMRDLGFTVNALPYNVMLSLYSRMRKHDNLDILMQEMDEKGIRYDVFTFSIRLNAFVATSNFEAMEKLLMKMEADPSITVDWNTYIVSANGFLKAGLTDKALSMLKRSEQVINVNSRRFAYEVLISLYTTVGSKDEVYRIWNLYKKIGRFYNSGYLSMVDSLTKLDDVDGAERIWEEWVSKKTSFDNRIPNVIMGAYAKTGLWEKAEVCVNIIIGNGIEPGPSTWGQLATAYCQGGQMAKAVETLKKAISVRKPRMKVNTYTSGACLEYLMGLGEAEAAGELLKMIKERCNLSKIGIDALENYMKPGNLSNREPLWKLMKRLT